MTAASTTLPATTLQPVAVRRYHPQIDISGRLSAQYQQNDQQQAVHINFSWSQRPQLTLISLDSPLGQTLATIQITPEGAQLTESGKAPRFANDVDQLVNDALGWPLPIAGLSEWLQGFIRTGTTPIIAVTPDQTNLHADGWELQYPAWVMEKNANSSENNPVLRPKRLDLSRQTEHVGLVSLRIVIDESVAP